MGKGKETYFQFNMFTGDLVDTRSRRQKKQAEEQEGYRQAEMFSQRELAQFGARANPKLPLAANMRLELAMQDPRSAEEKARDQQRQIEENTYPLPGVRDTGENSG